ncbi:uncharacterized protein LOC142775167 [Rhipicephalus microplus]|uniref:uncharacterized protein LOC142775167 n=1 Tax=Rhipicephalus microplus TaxID=6941 RepID=UPI003F6C1E4D
MASRHRVQIPKTTNNTLRNLDDKSVEYLDVINQAWKSGSVSKKWKTATTILIPKPGKPLKLDNLRPISLTSCFGTVAEHAILNSVTQYPEERGIFLPNIIIFRAGILTQGAKKPTRDQVININIKDIGDILVLGLESAVAVILCSLVAIALAGAVADGGYGGGVSTGVGGSVVVLNSGGHGHGKVVLGPSFLVKTVHHVNKVSSGGALVAHSGLSGTNGNGGYGNGGYGNGGYGNGGLVYMPVYGLGLGALGGVGMAGVGVGAFGGHGGYGGYGGYAGW